MKVATCSIVRLENQYLIEFVNHYKNLGVDHMFIYDNNIPDTECVVDVLHNYVDEGFVTIIDYTNQEERPMGKALIDAFTDCYELNKNEYDWILFLDNDEFLTLQIDDNIKDYLGRKEFDNIDIVKVNWLCYDDNGLVHYDNRPMKERFRHPCNGNPYLFEENKHIKSIINCNNTKHKPISFDCYYAAHSPMLDENLVICDNRGRILDSMIFVRIEEINYDLAYYAHYRMKTMEEYVFNKHKKLNEQGYTKLYFSSRIFFDYNKYTPYKEQIYLDNVCPYTRNVVYTVITNDYDELVDPEYVTPGWSYICLTTNRNIRSNVWRIFIIEEESLQYILSHKNDADWRNEMQYVNRYLKFIYAPILYQEYDFSIYVDGNVRLVGDLNEFKKNYIDVPGSYKYVMWALDHYRRNCIYDEIDECIRQDKDYKENLENLKKEYEEKDVPRNLGLTQNAVICRYHNDSRVKELARMMWDLISTRTVRDQCLLYYALWELGMLDSIKPLFSKLDTKYFKIIDNIHKT